MPLRSSAIEEADGSGGGHRDWGRAGGAPTGPGGGGRAGTGRDAGAAAPGGGVRGRPGGGRPDGPASGADPPVPAVADRPGAAGDRGARPARTAARTGSDRAGAGADRPRVGQRSCRRVGRRGGRGRHLRPLPASQAGPRGGADCPRHGLPDGLGVIPPEAAAVRRAWLTLAAQSALALAVVLVIAGGVAWLLLLHEERASEDGLLAQAVRPAARDDLTDPPPGVAMFAVDRSRRVVGTTPGTRLALLDPSGLRAEPSRPAWSSRTAAGTRYRVLTVADGSGWVQAALDLSGRDAERRRVLGVGLTAGVIGVLAAGAMGLVLARRAIAPLGEAIERQGRFVADASHELRTPLTLLHTRAQMVRRDLRAGDLGRVREEVAALERDAGRMGEVIEDLLLSAELGGGGVERAVVDVGALTADAATAVEGYAAGTGVQIVSRLEQVWVEGAPTALRRVVLSLLDNAVAHAARPDGEVRVAVSRDRTEAVLEISDNGAGFDQTIANHLFDRFARGTDAGGRRRFGLGLALVREVVTAHGGRVEAHSSSGNGATFRVRLPSAHPPAPRNR